MVLEKNMRKILTTFAIYDDARQEKYEKWIRPRFQKYADMHGLEFIEKNKSNWETIILHPEFAECGWGVVRENMHFNRWLYFQQLLDNNELKDGDIIYQFDCDIFIKEMNTFYDPQKSFSYAIDSGNGHCFGFLVIKINEFTRKLIKNIISRELWLKARVAKFLDDRTGQAVTWHIADQQMWYTLAGIKRYSKESFFNLPNYGFHSEVTELTLFPLEEIIDNVHILPLEWNVTHLLEETGRFGQRNEWDCNHTTEKDTILRHFAGGQPWRFEEYTNKYPLEWIYEK
jgi:hypothetical protein